MWYYTLDRTYGYRKNYPPGLLCYIENAHWEGDAVRLDDILFCSFSYFSEFYGQSILCGRKHFKLLPFDGVGEFNAL